MKQTSGFRERNSARETRPPTCHGVRIEEAEMQRQINMKLFIMAGDHVEGVTEVISAKAAVPSDGGIGIRKVSGA